MLATAGGMLSTVLMMPLVNLIGDVGVRLPGRDRRPVGGRVPDAGDFTVHHQRAHPVPPNATAGKMPRDIWRNDQWRIVDVLTILNITLPSARCAAGDDVLLHLDHGLAAGSVHCVPHHLLRRQPDRLRAGETAHRLEV